MGKSERKCRAAVRTIGVARENEPQTFTATLNGVDITSRFAPSSGGHEAIPLTLARGSNVLLLSVQGATATGRLATDTDGLVFIVQ